MNDHVSEMNFRPEQLRMLGIFEDAESSSGIVWIVISSVENQFVTMADQNNTDRCENQTTRDGWFSQPLAIQNHRHIDPFNGDQ